MSFQINLTVDLESNEVCNFIKDDAETEIDLDAGNSENAKTIGFQHYKTVNLQSDVVSGKLLRTKVKTFQQYKKSDGRPIRTLEAYETSSVEFFGRPDAEVYVMDGLDENQLQAIIDSIASFDPSKLGSDGLSYLDEIEQQLANAGVLSSKYYVFISLRLSKGSIDVLGSTEDALKQSVLEGEEDGLRQIGEGWICGAPDHFQPEDELEVPNIKDLEDEAAVEKIAQEKRIPELEKKTECSLVITNHRVGAIFQYPEFKIAWVLRDINIGKCTIVKTKLPQLQTRTRKRVLYVALATEASIKQQFEQDIRDCLATAAVSVGLLALVTGGMAIGAALKAFASAFTYCLDQKVKKLGSCIIPDIFLATDIGPWSPV